jgi:hypothetical protein
MARIARKTLLKFSAFELARALQKAGIIDAKDICMPKVWIEEDTIHLEWSDSEVEKFGFLG